jgi:hypothetical protein
MVDDSVAGSIATFVLFVYTVPCEGCFLLPLFSSYTSNGTFALLDGNTDADADAKNGDNCGNSRYCILL